MNFLYPGFLLALSAVAIPIVVHLFNFRKYRKVYFTNVIFLKEVAQKTSSSRQVRNYLILATRILTIVFLVLAFAKPYISSSDEVASTTSTVVSVYVDNSFSMEALNKEGSLLDEAKRRAKEIASSHGLNDKFHLITNDFEGRHFRLLSKEDFLNEVDLIQISSRTRTLKEVSDRQLALLADEGGYRKSAYLVSDFQKNLLSEPLQRDSLSFRLVRVRGNELPNISIDSVWFTTPIRRAGETMSLVVQLKNNSNVRSGNIPIKVFVNGSQKAIASLVLKPREARKDTLQLGGVPSGWQEGLVSITDNPVIFDDNFHFTFHVHKSLPVLVVNESLPNPYLQAVYRADPFFQVENTNAGNVNYSRLGAYQLIILNNLSNVSSGLAQQLRSYVSSGGTLMIFPLLSEDYSGLSTFLASLGTDVPEEIVSGEVKVSTLNSDHPAFTNVFETIPRNLDLPSTRRYFKYSQRSRTNKRTLLELPGRKSFLSEYKIGSGSIYLSAVPLDPEVSNLVQHSVFVPIMYQPALLTTKKNRLFYTLGQDETIQIGKTNIQANQVLKLKKGSFESIPDIRQAANITSLFIADQIREPGSYQLLKADSLVALFAFNPDKRESDLSYLTDNYLKENIRARSLEILTPGQESIQPKIEAVNSGTQLWKVCLILALVFIAAEILLIRFYKISENKVQPA